MSLVFKAVENNETGEKMATYLEIQNFVKNRYGYTPKTCWIAHAKEICGLPVRRTHNRMGKRVYPCPDNKLESIQSAFRHFGMI